MERSKCKGQRGESDDGNVPSEKLTATRKKTAKAAIMLKGYCRVCGVGELCRRYSLSFSFIVCSGSNLILLCESS